MELILTTLLTGLLLLILVIAALAVLVVFMTSTPYPYLGRYDSEKTFYSPSKSEKVEFPTIHDPPSMDLSIIVPAYNEEERLPHMMVEALEHLEKRQKANPSFSYEIIIVDDGSKDRTSEVGQDYTAKYGSDKVRVLTLQKNRGKGGAVRLGIFVARGKSLLFADADGASKFSDLDKLEQALSKLNKKSSGLAVVCGSRAHLEEDSVAKRSVFRTFLMYGFHFLVWFMCVRGVKDTQCGFKLLTRQAAILLFSNLHVERWAFDVDMLYLAQCFDIPIDEVAISWQEIEGSKMVPIWSWLQMGRDLILIRLRYMLGAWKINSKPKSS